MKNLGQKLIHVGIDIEYAGYEWIGYKIANHPERQVLTRYITLVNLAYEYHMSEFCKLLKAAEWLP